MRRSVLLALASLLVPLAAAGLTGPSVVSPSGAAPFDGLAIALADFAGDGHLKIVAQNDNGKVYVIDPPTGAVLATLQPGNAGCTSSCYQFEGVNGPINAPVVADVDKNGKLDVIVADTAAVVARYEFDPAHSTTTSYAFTKVWERRFGDFGAWTMDAAPIVADLNGDGQLDVAVVTEENGVFAVKPDGSLLWAVNRPGGHATPAVRDLDGDGKPELVVPRDDAVVDVYNGASGSVKWTVNVGVNPGSVPAAPLLSDVNGDGKPDVVVIARDAHDATNFANDHFTMIAYNSWGAQLWRWQPSWGAPMSHTRSVLVNVNGARAILGGDWNTIGHKPGNFERVGPGHVFLVDASGHELWHHDINAQSQSNKDLVVADAIGDGTQQVLTEGTSGGQEGILALDLATGAQKAFWSTGSWSITRGGAAGDLYGDGKFALAVPTSQGGAGAILIYHGTQALNAMFPGWAAIAPPHGAPGSLGNGTPPPPPPPPPPSGSYAPTFTPTGANEWWLQLRVTSDRPLAGIDASLNNGSWQPLALQSWGDWAASYHAPIGTIVKFQARATDGSIAASGCYHWTDRASLACPGGTTAPPPPPPPGNNTTSPPPAASNFTATFSHVRGNEWWIESDVTASGGTLAGVDARVNGGAWVALAHQSYGSWAKSIHAVAGSQVEFQARASDGSVFVSQKYAWPPA